MRTLSQQSIPNYGRFPEKNELMDLTRAKSIMVPRRQKAGAQVLIYRLNIHSYSHFADDRLQLWSARVWIVSERHIILLPTLVFKTMRAISKELEAFVKALNRKPDVIKNQQAFFSNDFKSKRFSGFGRCRPKRGSKIALLSWTE